jgi:hypothetical protein
MNNHKEVLTYRELKKDLMFGYDPGDAWGSCMGLFFDVAEEMYRRELDIPSAWQFKPGIGVMEGPDTEDGKFLATYARDEHLERLGKALHRLSRILEHQGRSY